MIIHTVLFRLQSELPEAARLQAAVAFKRDIEALSDVIGCVKDAHVGLNINREEEWDICLSASFATMADLTTYATHPRHVAAASRLKPFVAERACVDCER